jgi:large subunit ribosomal protein L1
LDVCSNPKAGTVVNAEDMGRAITEAKAGRVEFRLDKTANIHVPIGKVSFDEQKLFENFSALMEALRKARPSAAKGNYIKHITMTATMGPGIKIDANLAQSLEDTE